MGLGFTSCNVLLLDLLVDGDQSPTLDLLAYTLALGWRGEWAPSWIHRQRTIKNTFLIFWNTGTWEQIVRLPETFSLSLSLRVAEFLYLSPSQFRVAQCMLLCSFFLPYILYIWDPKLLTLVQLGLGLFSKLGFGCIFINMSNSCNLFIKIPTSV